MEDKIIYNRSDIKAVGGSQIAAICGLNPYQTPLDVYKLIVEGVQQPENAYMRAGKKLEAVIAQYYEEETGRHVVMPDNRIMFHPDYPFLCASIDRIIILPDGSKGVLECKATQQHWEEVREYHYTQLQWYLPFLQLQFGSVAWLERGLNFDYKDFEQNKELFSMMLEKAVEFWNKHVIPQSPPPPSEAADVRKYVRRQTAGKIIVAVPEEYSKIKLLKELQDKKSAIEGQIDELKNELILKMNDAESMTDSLGNELLNYKANKDGVQFDEKSFKEQHPELHKQFLITKQGARVFRVKIKG